MKNFFKKPLNIVSVALAVLGIVGILVMLIVPHGGKYVYKTTENDVEMQMTLKFKGDKISTSYKIGSKKTESDDVVTYEIKDGKLYVADMNTGYKINAFKIVMGEGEDAWVYKCTMTYVFFVVACAMAVAGIAGTVYGALTLKKKKS